MKMNKWTVALAAAGLVSLTAQAEEAKLVPVMSAVSATTISGYVDTSAQWNPGTGSGNYAPYSFNGGKQDGFNLDSVDLRVSKAADETQWSAGYMVDLFMGPDADGVNGSFGTSSDVIRQAYVDLRAPIGTGLGLKVGRFDGVIGYESIDSYKNANFTRSYGFTLEPTEHTGVILHYNFAEWLAVDAGVANTLYTAGINQKSSTESKKAYLGLVTLTAPKSWGFLADDTIVIGADRGENSTSNVSGDRTHVYAGSTIYTPLKGLTFGAAYDASFHTEASGFADAIGGYVAFKPEQSKWGTALRAEYAKGAFFGDSVGNPDFNKVFALTGTVSYDLWANVLTRLEARWDHALNSTDSIGGGQVNEIALLANLVYKF